MESIGLLLALVVLACGSHDPAKEANEFPYIVSIHRNAPRRNYMCAGSLIAPAWVLTTAHCLTKIAFRIRYGDMITKNGTYSPILQRIHHRNSRGSYHLKGIQRLTPKTNNIGLALIESIPDRPVARLAGIDYTSLLGHKVSYFEFGFLPVFKARIYESNKGRLIRPQKTKSWPKIQKAFGNYYDLAFKSRTNQSKSRLKGHQKKKVGAKIKNVLGNYSDLGIPPEIKVLLVGTGIPVRCNNADRPGPSMCVANKCFNFDEMEDPTLAFVTPDYGAPLVHDKMVVGVTSEVEIKYNIFTPLSPYLNWIRNHLDKEESYFFRT